MSFDSIDRSEARRIVQILLMSMSMLIFEVALVRLFSVLLFFHIVFFVLALALFGIGLGGLYGQFIRRFAKKGEELPRFTPLLPILLGFVMLFSLQSILNIPYGGRLAEFPGMRLMLLTFLVAMLPFFVGSLYFSLIFAARPKEATRLYFGDLVGAGIGAFLAIPALELLGGAAAPCFAASVAGVSSLVGTWNGRRRTQLSLVLALLILAAGIGGRNYWRDFHGSEAFFKYSNVSAPLFSGWNFYSHISVHEAPEFRGWRPDPNYSGTYPEHLMLWQDGGAPAFITRFNGDWKSVEYLKHDITSIPFRIAQPKDVLIVGLGGGRDVLTAKLYGASSIRGVELNGVTANDVMRGAFREYSGGVYDMDGVDVVVGNGRTFISRDKNRYDLVYSALADTQLGGGQGAYVLSENHLYTVEAFQGYFDLLTDEGMYVNVGIGQELRPLRRVTTMLQALELAGVENPADHLLFIRAPQEAPSYLFGHVLVATKMPVTPEIIERAQQAAAELSAELIWPPVNGETEWSRSIVEFLDPETRQSLYDANKYDISPVFDDRPYVFYDHKPKDFFRYLLNPRSPEFAHVSRARQSMYIIANLFGVAFICLVALMLAPLVLFERKALLQGGRAKPVLLFLTLFFGLGVAYILVELSILQQLFLLLGTPTLTFAVCLGLMLIFSGIGSLWSRRFSDEQLGQAMCAMPIVVVVLLLTTWWVLPTVVHASVGFPLFARLGIVGVLLFFVATPMGVLFPSGIRLLNRQGLDITCWGWGMNGVGSVLGSVGSTFISINFGVNATLLTGIAFYGVVVLAFYGIFLTGKRLGDSGA